jgi:hypothetical protein
MQKSDTEGLLRSLRRQTLAAGTDKIGTHQVDAHWSLAYACGQPPEPWEICRIPALHLMPATGFFDNHPIEIQKALQPTATWELLRLHAVEKLAFDAGMTEEECKVHGYPGNVQYYDYASKRWMATEIPRVRWFDGRELTRETAARTKDEFRATVDERLTKLRQKVTETPTPKRLNELSAYEKYAAGQFRTNLKKFDDAKRTARTWLDKLDTTRDFAKELFTLLRAAENAVRSARGIAAIGEAWVSETELLYRVRELLPGIEVVAHGQPKWLGRQHLDIWIPTHARGIEYHGLQHFESVEFFGGEEGFQRGQERDSRKRTLCEKNGLRLVEVAYDRNIDDVTLRSLIFQQ